MKGEDEGGRDGRSAAGSVESMEDGQTGVFLLGRHLPPPRGQQYGNLYKHQS